MTKFNRSKGEFYPFLSERKNMSKLENAGIEFKYMLAWQSPIDGCTFFRKYINGNGVGTTMADLKKDSRYPFNHDFAENLYIVYC